MHLLICWFIYLYLMFYFQAASVATANPSKFALFTQSVSAKYNVLKQSALKSDMYVKMSNFASNHKVAVERIKTVGTVAMTAAYVGGFLYLFF